MEKLATTGPIYQAGTLSGNPLAMAAGLACLTEVTKPNTYNRLTALTQKLVTGIQEKAQEASIPLVVNHLGGMFALLFTTAQQVKCYQDVTQCNIENFKKFFHYMLNEGVYLASSSFETNFMSIAHSDEDIDCTIKAAEKAFKKMR